MPCSINYSNSILHMRSFGAPAAFAALTTAVKTRARSRDKCDHATNATFPGFSWSSALSHDISISKSYGPAKSSKTIHFLHDTENVTTGIKKSFDMTAVVILVIPLIILLNGNQ